LGQGAAAADGDAQTLSGGMSGCGTANRLMG
jgi:hypothetical protein